MKRTLSLLTLLSIVVFVPAAGLAAVAPNESQDLRASRAPRAFTPISARAGAEVASWTKSSCTSDAGDTCTCGAGKLCIAGADGCACIRPMQ